MAEEKRITGLKRLGVVGAFVAQTLGIAPKPPAEAPSARTQTATVTQRAEDSSHAKTRAHEHALEPTHPAEPPEQPHSGDEAKNEDVKSEAEEAGDLNTAGQGRTHLGQEQHPAPAEPDSRDVARRSAETTTTDSETPGAPRVAPLEPEPAAASDPTPPTPAASDAAPAAVESTPAPESGPAARGNAGR